MKNVDFPRFSARKPYVFFHCFWTFLDPFWRRSLRPKPHRGPGVPCLESLPWLGGAELGEPHEPATETAARERRPGRERAQNTRKSRVFGAMSIDFRWSSMVFSHVFPWFSMFFCCFFSYFSIKIAWRWTDVHLFSVAPPWRCEARSSRPWRRSCGGSSRSC